MYIARTFVTFGLALALATSGCAGRPVGMARLRSGVRGLKQAIAQESEVPGPAYRAALQKAVQLLATACAECPESPSAHVNLGLAYWRQGQTDKAVAFLEKGCRLSSNDPRPFEFLAAAYSEQQLWDKARAALDIANQRHSYSPRILTAMAATEYFAGHADLAETFLSQAIRASDAYAPALYSMAVVQRDRHGDEEKARAYFTQYLAATDGDPPPDDASPLQKAARRDRIRIAQAYLAEEDSRRRPQPQEHSGASASGAPPETNPHTQPATAGAGPRERPNGSARSEISPREQALQVWGRGLEAYNSGDMNGAIRLYEQALDLDPNLTSATYNLGLAHRNSGNNDAAQNAFTRTIKIDTEFVQAYYMLGLIHREQKRYRLAIEQLEMALEKDAGFARAHFVLALIYRKNGQAAVMRNHLESFIRLAPGDAYASRARELLNQ